MVRTSKIAGLTGFFMLRTLLTVVVVVLPFMAFKKNSLLIDFKWMLQLIFIILILKTH